MEMNKLKEFIFEKGKAMGFEDMEVYYQSDGQFHCRIFKGDIDHYSVSKEGGLSFRGVYEGKMGYAYTEKIEVDSVDMLLEKAKENAQVVESDEEEIIFEGSPIYTKLELFSEELSKVSTEHKLEIIKDLEQEIYALDSRVKNVDYCFYEEYENERMLFNTRGLNKKEKSNFFFVYASTVVKEGDDIKNGDAYLGCQDFKRLDYKALAKESVNKAVSFLGAEPVKSKEYSILLKNQAAADLLLTFSGIFSAENVQKGRSLLKNKLGAAIANSQISIIDNPLMVGGAASRSFDSEGVASKKVAVVEQGILKSLLHNLKTAKKDGVEPTGHGFKSSYKGTVTVAPSNFYIEPGSLTYEELVAGLEEGLIITELEGLHSGANPISGDFSLAAKGYLVEKGNVVKAVNEITIAGNFYEFLNNIEAVGKDIDFTFPRGSYVGSPTLKVKSLSVAGK